MTLAEMLERLHFNPDLLTQELESPEQMELLYDTEIAIHQQYSWPLKGRLDNVCVLDDSIAFASGTASEYGDKKAWDDPDYM